MNININFYTVFENIRFNNTGYLNIGFYYNIKIYNVTTLINSRFGRVISSGGCSWSSGVASANRIIIFSELIIIFENFSEIVGNFKLFNKNIIFKLKVLNIKSITNAESNFST